MQRPGEFSPAFAAAVVVMATTPPDSGTQVPSGRPRGRRASVDQLLARDIVGRADKLGPHASAKGIDDRRAKTKAAKQARKKNRK